MKLGAVHFTVQDVEAERQFWQKLLPATPKTVKENWAELKAGDVRITFSLGEADGSACRPVFEYTEMEIHHYIQKAVDLGAELVREAFNDPAVRGAILRDPEGHEFQLTRALR